jgi:hypothetical protein
MQKLVTDEGGENDPNNARYADWILVGVCGLRDGTVQRTGGNARD